MNPAYIEDSSSGEEDNQRPCWIKWFCGLKGNEFFVEVDDSFIQDSFNLTGLSTQVPLFSWALDLILDGEDSEEAISKDEAENVEADAELLYGLIHARFILTARGLEAMYEKFKKSEFGRCPRVLCQEQDVVPVGLTDSHGLECVRIYCPKCEEIYASKYSRHAFIDGAFFGTTFPHLFFLTYPECKPRKVPSLPARVFGFKVHSSAYAVSLEYKRKQKQEEERQQQQTNRKAGKRM